MQAWKVTCTGKEKGGDKKGLKQEEQRRKGKSQRNIGLERA